MSNNDLTDLTQQRTAGLFARYLRAQQVIDEARLRYAWGLFNEKGGHYGAILVQLGYLNQNQINTYLQRMQAAAASLTMSNESLADTSRVSYTGPPQTRNFGPRTTSNFGPPINPLGQSSAVAPMPPVPSGSFPTAGSSSQNLAPGLHLSGVGAPSPTPSHPQTGRFNRSGVLPPVKSSDGEQTLAVSGEFVAVGGSTPGSAITPHFMSGDGDRTLAVSGDWQGQSSQYLPYGSSDGVLMEQPKQSVDLLKALEDNYEVLGELSRGGMGVIYRVKHRQTGKKQALKVILNKDVNPNEFQRFQLEARVLAHIEHRNIIRIFETGKEADKPFFTMELIQGGDLKRHVDNSLRNTGSVPSFYWTAEVMLALASGLAHCHEKGVVHRDFKPANVLIEEESNRPVIIDFGLVKRDSSKLKENFESLADDLTKTGQMLGTPAYMAPEQVDNKGSFGEIGPPADVWGFGATLYYCLTGEPPYKGETIVNILKQLMTGEPARPSTINPEVPEWLDDLCANCLKHQQSDRLTMEDISDSLFVPLTAWKKSRGSGGKKLKVALFLIAFLFLGVAGFFLSGPSEPPRPPTVDIQSASLQQRLTITGTVGPNAEAVYIAINDKGSPQQIPLEERSFNTKVKLVKGENLVVLFTSNGAGKSAEVRSKVFFDTDAPTLSFKAYPSRTLESELTIEGIVSEPCKLNGPGLDTLEVDGEFKLTLELKDENSKAGLFRFPITVTDRVGLNVTEVINIQKLPTYRVDPDNDQGKNSFRTLKDAIREAVPGARIIVTPGIHQGPFLIDKDLEIVSESKDRNDVILRSPVESKVAPCMEFYGTRGYFRNLTFVGYSAQTNLHAVLVSRGQVLFENCVIRCPNARGLAVTRTMNAAEDKERKVEVTLKESLIEKCDYSGIIVDKGAEIIVESCQFRNIKRYGLRVGHKSKGSIKDSTFQKSIVGLYVTEFTEVLVDNCRFFSNTEGSIVEKTSKVTFNKSIFSENESGVYTTHDSVVTLRRSKLNNNSYYGAHADRGAKIIGVDSTFLGNKYYGLYINRGKEYIKDILKGTSRVVKGDPASAEVTRCQFGSNGKGDKKHDKHSTIVEK